MGGGTVTDQGQTRKPLKDLERVRLLLKQLETARAQPWGVHAFPSAGAFARLLQRQPTPGRRLEDGVLHLHDAETGLPSKTLSNHQRRGKPPWAFSSLAFLSALPRPPGPGLDVSTVGWSAPSAGPHIRTCDRSVLALDFQPRRASAWRPGGGAAARTG